MAYGVGSFGEAPFSADRALTGGGPTYTLTAATGTYTLTGVAAAFKVSRKLVAATGTYTLTGNAATLTYTPVSGATYTLTATTGTFTLSGISATFKVSRKLSTTTGSYTLSGVSANLVVSRKLVAATGTYTLTGNAATLTRSPYRLQAQTGTYTLTGKDVAFFLNGVQVVTTKGGSVTRYNLTLKQKKRLKKKVNEEWLKADATANELLTERVVRKLPTAKQQVEALLATDSLSEVIGALKALTKEAATLPEQKAVVVALKKEVQAKEEKTEDKFEVLTKQLVALEKKVNNLEDMVLASLSELL